MGLMPWSLTLMPSWTLVAFAPVVADAGVMTLQQVPAWIGMTVTVGTMFAGVVATVTMVKADIGGLRTDMQAVREIAARTETRLTQHIENDHAPHGAEVFTQREAVEARRTADAVHEGLRQQLDALKRT